jgi:hypothetical protein
VGEDREVSNAVLSLLRLDIPLIAILFMIPAILGRSKTISSEQPSICRPRSPRRSPVSPSWFRRLSRPSTHEIRLNCACVSEPLDLLGLKDIVLISDPQILQRAAKMPHFPPAEAVLTQITLTRTAYAQLKGQEFWPSKAFGREWTDPMGGDTDKDVIGGTRPAGEKEWRERGVKVVRTKACTSSFSAWKLTSSSVTRLSVSRSCVGSLRVEPRSILRSTPPQKQSVHRRSRSCIA